MKTLPACSLAVALAAVAVLACGSDGDTGPSGTGAPPAGGSSTADGRPVSVVGSVPYGATCSSDAQCGGAPDSCCTGGKCSGAGWCSPRCKDDRDCPASFYCVDHSGTRCFAGCEDDRGCPPGWICDDKSGRKTCRYK